MPSSTRVITGQVQKLTIMACPYDAKHGAVVYLPTKLVVMFGYTLGLMW